MSAEGICRMVGVSARPLNLDPADIDMIIDVILYGDIEEIPCLIPGEGGAEIDPNDIEARVRLAVASTIYGLTPAGIRAYRALIQSNGGDT